MKKMLVGAVTGLLVLSLAACSGGGGTTTNDGTNAPGPDALENAEGVTTITFWHGLGGANGEALEKSIADFNAENSGKIQVQSSFQGTYADLLAKYTAGLRDQSTPTVILAGDIASGYLKDVQRSVAPAAMAEANPDELDLSEIRSVGTNYYSVDGDLFAVPLNMSTPALWVNTDMLKAAGVNPDTDLKTLEDVAAAAAKVKSATGNAGLVQPFDGWWFEQLTAASGNVYCTPGNGREGDGAESISLTEPGQVAAFKTVADIYTSGAGLDVGVDGNAALTAFTAGQVAMMFNSSGAAGGLAAGNVPFTYEALPYPISGDAAESGPVIGGSAMWLSSTADDAQKVAGWKLISYLASAETQEPFSEATGYVPVNSAVDDLPARAEYLSSRPNAAVFVDQLNANPAVPATAGCLSGAMTAIRGAVVPQMQAAFTGSISLDQALSNAETEANKAISQYREQRG
ncbi:MAG: extracellular solute-binding protein [Microbacterium sp.]|jgi:sn-glycerol 3-phosphate transport system substrate-binding protein|nr:extracellular solute-binding protein [Microbacterium sp.]